MKKTHNSVDVIFGPRVCIHNVGVNAYFGPRRRNSLLSTTNYGQRNTKYNMDYHIKRYCCTLKLADERPKLTICNM